MNFEWDIIKAGINKTKHGISFEEASEIFADDYSLSVYDPDHSYDEERFVIFGRSKGNIYLVVAYTEHSDIIRIISARQMTRREIMAYEK